MLGWKRLALKINVRAQVDNLPYSPAESHSNTTAENAHRACLGKEQFLHIAVAGANGFHDSNLAPALENCHHQRIHDSDEGDSQARLPKIPRNTSSTLKNCWMLLLASRIENVLKPIFFTASSTACMQPGFFTRTFTDE